MFSTVADALAFGTIAISGSGVAITALCKWRPKGSNGYMRQDLCDERSAAIQKDIKEIKDTLKDIYAGINGKGK